MTGRAYPVNKIQLTKAEIVRHAIEDSEVARKVRVEVVLPSGYERQRGVIRIIKIIGLFPCLVEN